MTLKPLIASMILALSAGAASAATITLIPTGPGMHSAIVAQSVDGLFLDNFDFAPDAFDGTVSVSLFGITGPVSFFAASLNGQDFAYLPESGSSTFSFSAQVTSAMPLGLTVFGAVLDNVGNPGGAGLYSVSINTVAAVPEPETYVLLLAGLGVVGLMARRRGRGA